MAPAVRHASHPFSEVPLLHGAGALGTALAAALLSSAGLLTWRAWPSAVPVLRTIARVTVLYLGNARG